MKSYSKEDNPRFTRGFWKGTAMCIVFSFLAASVGIVGIVNLFAWFAKEVLK